MKLVHWFLKYSLTTSNVYNWISQMILLAQDALNASRWCIKAPWCMHSKPGFESTNNKPKKYFLKGFWSHSFHSFLSFLLTRELSMRVQNAEICTRIPANKPATSAMVVVAGMTVVTAYLLCWQTAARGYSELLAHLSMHSSHPGPPPGRLRTLPPGATLV